MRLNAHIAFNGNCEAAFKLYQHCLDGEIVTMLSYGSSPRASTHPGLQDKIVHAELKLGDQSLTGADGAADAYQKPQGFAILLNIEEPEDARRIFDGLAEGGVVQMPLQKNFGLNTTVSSPTDSVYRGR